MDPESGRRFHYNVRTREVQWVAKQLIQLDFDDDGSRGGGGGVAKKSKKKSKKQLKKEAERELAASFFNQT